MLDKEKIKNKFHELYPKIGERYAIGPKGEFGNYHFLLRVFTKDKVLNFNRYDDFDEDSETKIREISYDTYEKICDNKDMILNNVDILEEKIKIGEFEGHNSIEPEQFDDFREIINVISDTIENLRATK